MVTSKKMAHETGDRFEEFIDLELKGPDLDNKKEMKRVKKMMDNNMKSLEWLFKEEEGEKK